MRYKDLLTKLGLILVSTLFSLLLTYSFFLCLNGFELYSAIKMPSRGWLGKTHRADSVLGFSPIPNANGEHTFPIGPNIPMRFDEGGFRVPVNAPPLPIRRPLILFLGCSFTYGDGVYAEESFPFIVGLKMNASSINGGVCSYGYTQMLIRAKELIPKFKPDYVIFQVSPWLLMRALSPYAPSLYGDVPVPYVCTHNQSGRFITTPPPFQPKVFDLPFEAFRETAKSLPDYLTFMTTVFLPLKIHDHYNEARAKLHDLIDECDTPADTIHTLNFIFSTIRQIAENSGSKLFFLKIDGQIGQSSEPLLFEEKIDAAASLRSNLIEQSPAAYEKSYGIWRGQPPKLIDQHPNAGAHQIIAESIIQKLMQDK